MTNQSIFRKYVKDTYMVKSSATISVISLVDFLLEQARHEFLVLTVTQDRQKASTSNQPLQEEDFCGEKEILANNAELKKTRLE